MTKATRVLRIPLKPKYGLNGTRSTQREEVPSGVVFAVWSEDVQNLGVFLCGSLMFDIAWNQEAVSRGCLDDPARMLKCEMPADDVHHLFVRMAVPRAHPTLRHPMPDGN